MHIVNPYTKICLEDYIYDLSLSKFVHFSNLSYINNAKPYKLQ